MLVCHATLTARSFPTRPAFAHRSMSLMIIKTEKEQSFMLRHQNIEIMTIIFLSSIPALTLGSSHRAVDCKSILWCHFWQVFRSGKCFWIRCEVQSRSLIFTIHFLAAERPLVTVVCWRCRSPVKKTRTICSQNRVRAHESLRESGAPSRPVGGFPLGAVIGSRVHVSSKRVCWRWEKEFGVKKNRRVYVWNQRSLPTEH